MTTCAAEIYTPWMCSVAHFSPARYKLWNKKQLKFKHKVWAKAMLTDRSPMNTNFQPFKEALTAKSMSSTVVRSFHPPALARACILHTPAVPAMISNLRPSTKDQLQSSQKLTIESEEWVSRWSHFLLHTEVVIQGHLLEACQYAFIGIHYNHQDDFFFGRNQDGFFFLTPTFQDLGF